MLTSDDVRLMAFEAYQSSPVPAVMLMTQEALEHLTAAAYAAGQAAEREACADICDDLHWNWRVGDNSGPKECATAIRARSEKGGQL